MVEAAIYQFVTAKITVNVLPQISPLSPRPESPLEDIPLYREKIILCFFPIYSAACWSDCCSCLLRKRWCSMWVPDVNQVIFQGSQSLDSAIAVFLSLWHPNKGEEKANRLISPCLMISIVSRARRCGIAGGYESQESNASSPTFSPKRVND